MEPNAPDTSNFLDWVEIKNFKSIKDLRLDCKRVNIFIGKPNVGKSNILEALGMLGAEYFDGGFMKGAVRYNDVKQLFYQNDPAEPSAIKTGVYRGILSRSANSKDEFEYSLSKFYDHSTLDIPVHRLALKTEQGMGRKEAQNYAQELRKNGEIRNNIRSETYRGETTSVKKYDFKNKTEFEDSYRGFLLPHGENFFEVIDRRNELKNEFGKIFQQQGLDLVLDRDKQTIELQRKDGFYVHKYAYYTIADTFRRFMFYIAAIESNKDSVLIFEEPEVHSFPPYTQDVAYRMIYSTDNQFFVSTHSPYLLQTLVENLGDDQLSVFVTYYENYETKAKALTPEELSFVQEYSTDVFFNLDRFIPTANAASIS